MFAQSASFQDDLRLVRVGAGLAGFRSGGLEVRGTQGWIPVIGQTQTHRQCDTGAFEDITLQPTTNNPRTHEPMDPRHEGSGRS